jgi:TonB-linked SusC/RagA family outer membrane protein
MYKIFTAFICGKERRCFYKPVLIMKLILVLLTATFLQVSAATYAQRVTLKLNNVDIREVFAKIQSQTNYDFLYNSADVQQAKLVSIDLNNATLKEALDKCFTNQPLLYSIENTTILIIRKPVPIINNKNIKKLISGKVTDNKGMAIAGATIREKNTQNVVATDGFGNYSINVADEGAVLVFTFVGFTTQEIPVAAQSKIDVVMMDSSTGLNDVVVVGYGTQRRKDVTGAIATVSEKTLREVPATNAQQLLQGRVAGVYVVQGANKPGSQPTVRIRGTRSFSATNDPLYVVDGIPIQGGLNDINPNDIETMDVLKDASATAIYGSRGANGVVIITTKRGKEGKPVISYNMYFGLNKISRYADIMDAQQFIAVRRIFNGKAGDDASADANFFSLDELPRVKAGNNTDWTKLITRDGFTQNHELAVRGGTKATRYSLSLGLYDEKGYFKIQDYKRYTTRINFDQDFGNGIKVGISQLGSFSITDGANRNPYYGSVIESPLGVPYNADGTLNPMPNFPDLLMYNPLTDFVDGALIDKDKRLRLLTTLYGEAELFKGFKIRTNFGPDLTNARNGQFNGSISTASRGNQPSASNNESFVLSYTWENYFTYDRLFGKHKINLTGLYSIQEQTTESSTVGSNLLPVESIEYYNIGAGTNNLYGSDYQKFSLESFMGRLNYSFNSRLLLTLTGRADGSSRFSPGNKWGFFPSAALAYNFSDESFLKNSKWLSSLKLRASYGSVGNPSINPYQTQGILSGIRYDFNGVAVSGRNPGSIANPDLKWERTAKANVGVDFGFFNNRIAGSLDFYNEKTTDLLLPFALPGTTGFTSTLRNVGSTLNRGFEFNVNTQNIVSTTGGFEWSTNINMAYNKEKIIELSQGKLDDLGNLRFIGQPQNVIYDYEKIGIWQLGEEAEAAKYKTAVGQIKVKDQNGDNVINAADRVILGKTRPSVTLGFGNRFSYRSFDMSFLVVANTGFLITSPLHTANSLTLAGRYNGLDVDYWTPTNPTNAYPKPTNTNSGLYFSTLSYFKGDFARIRNVNFGYSLPKLIAQKIKAQSVRLSFDITNPYVFSSYVHKEKGIDPEVRDNPMTINYLFGINVNF